MLISFIAVWKTNCHKIHCTIDQIKLLVALHELHLTPINYALLIVIFNNSHSQKEGNAIQICGD